MHSIRFYRHVRGEAATHVMSKLLHRNGRLLTLLLTACKNLYRHFIEVSVISMQQMNQTTSSPPFPFIDHVVSMEAKRECTENRVRDKSGEREEKEGLWTSHCTLNSHPVYSAQLVVFVESQRRGGKKGRSSPALLHFITFLLFLSLSSDKIQYGN